MNDRSEEVKFEVFVFEMFLRPSGAAAVAATFHPATNISKALSVFMAHRLLPRRYFSKVFLFLLRRFHFAYRRFYGKLRSNFLF